MKNTSLSLVFSQEIAGSNEIPDNKNRIKFSKLTKQTFLAQIGLNHTSVSSQTYRVVFFLAVILSSTNLTNEFLQATQRKTCQTTFDSSKLFKSCIPFMILKPPSCYPYIFEISFTSSRRSRFDQSNDEMNQRQSFINFQM